MWKSAQNKVWTQQRRKAQFGDAAILGQGRTKVKRISRFCVKGVSRVARRLEKGMHGCVAPGLCEGAPNGEQGRGRPVCATTWHRFLGDLGERPPIVQVCTMWLGEVLRLWTKVCLEQRRPCVVTWRRAQVEQTTRSCDEVNEGLVSRATTVRRRRRVGQPSLPKLWKLAKCKFGVSQDLTCTL